MSGDLGSELDSSDLTEEEKEKLKQVMEKAKQFEKATAEALAAPPEGMLLKWTNAFKGFQPRWFSMDQQQGVLHYYMSEDRKKLPPRGSLQMWGALVAPSEEDSQTFSVSGSNGEVFRLKAADTRERQFWVSRLRREVERANKKFNKESHSTAPQTLTTTPSDTSSTHLTTPTRSLRQRLGTLGTHRKSSHKSKESVDGGFPGGDAMREAFSRLQTYQQNMEMQLDSYSAQSGLNPLDKNVLLLRASSKAAVSRIKDCLALLKVHHVDPDQMSTTSVGGDKDGQRHNSFSNSPAKALSNEGTNTSKSQSTNS